MTPKPAEEFEIRFVVFDTVDIIAMDVEGTSDVYCRAYFDTKEEVHETDCHFRCMDGKASFNYRLVYHIKHPRKQYIMTLQAYDRDFFKSNDMIGEVTIDLKDPILDSALSGRPLCVNKKYYNDYMKPKGAVFTYKDDNSFFVDIKGLDAKTGVVKTNGKVRVQIDILPILSYLYLLF